MTKLNDNGDDTMFDKIDKLKAELIEASHELTTRIEEYENKLKGIGVTVYIPLDEDCFLGYAKLDRWGLVSCFKDKAQLRFLVHAPRYIRLMAMDKMPELIKELELKAEDTIQKLKDAK